jgi:hypothetical protein
MSEGSSVTGERTSPKPAGTGWRGSFVAVSRPFESGGPLEVRSFAEPPPLFSKSLP